MPGRARGGHLVRLGVKVRAGELRSPDVRIKEGHMNVFGLATHRKMVAA